MDESPEQLEPLAPIGEGDSLVPVGSASSEAIARIWMQILEDSGIRSVIHGGRPVSGLLGDFSLNMPYDIYVRESEAEQAAEILESLTEVEEDVPDEEEELSGP